MTTQTAATAPGMSVGRRRRSLITAPAVAGIAYTTAWVLGLAVWPSNLDVAATDAKVVTTYSAHPGAAMTQYLLLEGLAAIALAVVATALGRAARRNRAERLGRVTVVAGLTAVALSLAECALGLLLAGSAAPHGETDRTGRLFDLINRIDGVKMVALAAMAVAGAGLVSPHGASPLAGLHGGRPDGGADCLRRRLSAAEHDACSGGVRIRPAAARLGDRGRRGPRPDRSIAVRRPTRTPADGDEALAFQHRCRGTRCDHFLSRREKAHRSRTRPVASRRSRPRAIKAVAGSP